MAIWAAVIGLATQGAKMWKDSRPTPEEQKAKSGVWYKMLLDLFRSDDSNESFIARWLSQLPFKQTATKENFMASQIRGKNKTEIVGVLVGKINDELKKGGFTGISEQAILEGMGIVGYSGDSGGRMSDVTGGVLDSSIDPLVTRFKDVNESRNVFYTIAFVVTSSLIVWSVFFKKK